ncbi:MAG: lysoplasmalogenase [Phycisphaerae bacterium]|nr:lysoplasmalogenase [Saprospiraceae bacterium]
MKNLLLIAFFAAGLLHLLGDAMANSSLAFITKPLLMPLLAAWLVAATNRRNEYSFLRKSVLGALVLSTLGDVLLMFSSGIFFLLGLASFLLAHLFYIGAFTSICSFKNGFLKRNPWWILPFLTFPILLLMLLWNGIPVGMKLPVAAYAGIISVMALSVVNLKGKIANQIFWTLLAGAVLFLTSDGSLAVAKFGQPFEGSRLVIMVTYLGGQFLLVRGVVAILSRSKPLPEG